MGSTSLPALLRLQRTAGNTAVVAALQVQRQDQDQAAETEADVPQLDPALARHLRELFPDQDAGTYQVVGGSTGAQSTSGELTAGALATWQHEQIDFEEAYRRSADRSHPDGERAVEPTRGGGSSSVRGVRWGLLFAVWDYHNLQGRPTNELDIPGASAPRPASNLSDVRAMLQEGSPYRTAAEATYDHHRVVENPTATEMSSNILDEIVAVSRAGGGRLTVNFQGHGGRGSIEGVDGDVLDRRTLRMLGEMASEQGVHLTFVLDTCNVGSAALLAENTEMANLIEGADDLPPEALAELRSIGEPLVQLTQLGLRLNDLAVDLRWVEVGTAEQRQETRATLEAARAALEDLSAHCRDHPEIIGGPELRMLAIPPEIEFRLLLDAASFTRAQARGSRELLAPLLDRLNEVLSDGVDRLRALTERGQRRRAGG